MPAEPNLHDLFRAESDSTTGSIDTQSVIRRSRRRRLPAQIGVGSVFTLAIAGVGVAGITGVRNLGNSGGSASTASDSSVSATDSPMTAEGAPTGSSAGAKRAPASRINLCGGTLAEVAPSDSGLVLTTHFSDAAVGAKSVAGIVTLTNTGTATVKGWTGPTPTVTLSQKGIVLWHSNGPEIALGVQVDLAPGESMDYKTTFTPVVCGVEDDTAESFRDDLPAAPAGVYQLSAAMDVSSDDTGDALLVTGPLSNITLK
ncbi:hypothetical protein [Glaciihabitans sp. dw_435]|uniref:hypothetical protein n=1 Tax=Glaciihabitans sp. dw_435 TaxID=2720081 RepID=UPI001BD5A26D|nr:hypothetical protein [Glaciihabitans sp. dw_435]